MQQLEFEGFTKVMDIEKKLNLTRGALNYRIKKNGFETFYKHTGPGQKTAFVSDDHAQILMLPMYKDWSDYIMVSQLAEETGTSVHIIGRAASELGLESVRGVKKKGGSPYNLYAPDDADHIRRYFKMRESGEYLYSSVTKNNDTLNTNRARSLYHRLTPYGGVLPWET